MPDYCSPEFSMHDLWEEFRALFEMGRSFIEISTHRVLDQCLKDLRNIGSSKSTTPQLWTIRDKPSSQPLRTIVTNGYECGDRAGGRELVGELAFKWMVQLTDRTRTKAFAQQRFRIAGNASIQLRILPSDGDAPIAQWQFEIGAQNSPGAFFHIGVGKVGGDFFPDDLPVPRLPGLLVTPTDALDFLLGELFQTDWRRENDKDSDAHKTFGKRQRDRLKRHLEWHVGQLPTECSGSAWNRLKNAKPAKPIFVDT